MILSRGSLWQVLRLALLALLADGCGGDGSRGADAGRDTSHDPTEAAACESKATAFRDFVATHGDCTSDSECAVVGDCGPNADFAAVRAESAAMAYTLQVARCAGTWDGPLFDARCSAGECTLVERTDACCGCAPSDGGR
jgi:hypothetical protein